MEGAMITATSVWEEDQTNKNKNFSKGERCHEQE